MAQPHRGERVLLGTRVPPDMGEVVKEVAKQRGYRSVSDYLLALAAEDVDYPITDPRATYSRDQEALPLTG
jgi:hypothetical protein